MTTFFKYARKIEFNDSNFSTFYIFIIQQKLTIIYVKILKSAREDLNNSN